MNQTTQNADFLQAAQPQAAAPVQQAANTGSPSKPMSPEEVAEQNRLKANLNLSLKSKEDCETEGFALLAPDVFYKFTVERVELREQQKYQSTEMETKIMLVFKVAGVDGAPVKNIDGAVETNDRLFWEWLSTTSTGYKSDGTPSKTRQCLTALMGVNVDSELDLPDVDSLIGKKCRGLMDLRTKKDGGQKNVVIKYAAA